MTTQRDAVLQEIQSIRSELGRLLEGMDYCLDWKPNDEEFSAREIVYHIVDTPSGGIHTAVQGVLSGSVQELPIASSLTNMTEERQENDLDKVREDLETVLAGLEKALASTTDAELDSKRVPLHSITRSMTTERSVEDLVSGIFVRHWREHLGQLAALQEALGLE